MDNVSDGDKWNEEKESRYKGKTDKGVLFFMGIYLGKTCKQGLFDIEIDTSSKRGREMQVYLGKCMSGRRNSQCKVPEEGVCFNVQPEKEASVRGK